MGTLRKRHGTKLKSDVALDALRGEKTVTEIASKFKVHPTQVSQWKRNLRGLQTWPIQNGPGNDYENH